MRECWRRDCWSRNAGNEAAAGETLLSLPVTLEAICETSDHERLLAATAGNKTAGGEGAGGENWRRGCSPDGDADNEAAGAGNELAHCPPCCHGACNEGIPIRLTRRAFYGAKNKPVRAVRVEVCPRPVHNNASP